MSPPEQLVDALYQLRAERRVAEVATVPATAVPAPGAPSDSDLAAAYDQHKADNFRVPELRSFSLAILGNDDIAKGIKPSDDKLREDYQARIAEFTTPERRHLQQILLPDEAKAKEAAQLLAGGKDFAEVAKEVAGMPADKLDLDFFARDDLPPKLGDAAFALKVNETTEPIEDELGWHILRVTEIKPEETTPFEAVKDKLAADAARDAAGDQVATMANSIDDKLAGGAAFADIVSSFGLKVTKSKTSIRTAAMPPASRWNCRSPATRSSDRFRHRRGPDSQLSELGRRLFPGPGRQRRARAARPLADVQDW